MPSNTSNIYNKKIGQILSICVTIFCFIIFPAFILDVGLTNYFQLKLQNYKNNQFQRLNDRIDDLDKFSDNDKYFSSLFNKIFKDASSSDNPQKIVHKYLKHLKRKYGDKLNFIVWDANGKIVESLTDFTKFQYVIRKLFESIRLVWTNQISLNPSSIKDIPTLEQKLKLVKKFLGKVFLPQSLLNPYSKTSLNKLSLIREGNSKSYYWYHINNRLGLFCFINRDLVKSNSGLKSIIDVFNRENKDIKCGFAKILDPLNPYYPITNTQTKEISLALGKFENTSEPFTETKNGLYVIRTLNSKLRGFAFITKHAKLFNIYLQKNIILTKVLLVYLLGFLLLELASRYRFRFISLRWKLTFLFMYANLLPLMVLGFISHSYLDIKENSLATSFQSESLKLIKEFDLRYNTIEYSMENRINSFLNEFNKNTNGLITSPNNINILKNKIHDYKSYESYLIASSGKTIFAIDAHGNHVKHSFDFIKETTKEILGSINSMTYIGDIKNNVGNRGLIWPIRLRDTHRKAFWNLIQNTKTGSNDFALYYLWNSSTFQKQYIINKLTQIRSTTPNLSIIAVEIDTQRVFPKSIKISENIKKFILKTIKHKTHFASNISWKGKKHLLTGMVGKNLDNIAIITILPSDQIKSAISQFLFNLLLGGLANILLAILIGYLLSRQFLTPISDFGNAAKAIANRDYSYKTAVAGNDEFGKLGKILNRVIEGLEDFEIAKVVQSNLLPESRLSRPPYQIFGKSVVMTVLGGDYFDYIDLDNNKFGIVMGDVAGHGIPAGLIMAMAKAGVEMADEETRNNPAQLMKAIHSIIYSLKNKKLKRMMTCQYLVIEQHSGKIIFSNAGHCFPVIINHKNKTAEYIKHIGGPLGIMRRAKYTNIEFTLEEGDNLILYSDGIVEAQDKNGFPLGFEDFKYLSLDCYNENPEVFYNTLQAAHVSRTKEIDDDSTIIIINRNKMNTTQ